MQGPALMSEDGRTWDQRAEIRATAPWGQRPPAAPPTTSTRSSGSPTSGAGPSMPPRERECGPTSCTGSGGSNPRNSSRIWSGCSSASILTTPAAWGRRCSPKARQLEPWEGEYRAVLPDGTLRWLVTRTAALVDETGAIVGALGTSQDITDRKVAEEQVRFQAHLLEAVGEAIIATDLNGRHRLLGPGRREALRLDRGGGPRPQDGRRRARPPRRGRIAPRP